MCFADPWTKTLCHHDLLSEAQQGPFEEKALSICLNAFMLLTFCCLFVFNMMLAFLSYLCSSAPAWQRRVPLTHRPLL